jgi:hypothetical protein
MVELMKHHILTYEEIKMITNSLVSINRTNSDQEKADALEKLIFSTGEAIMKVRRS